MSGDVVELDRLQSAYKTAVEELIATIKQEEAPASPATHSVAEVDGWEQAHFAEDGIRKRVKAAKKDYEDALRKRFFDF